MSIHIVETESVAPIPWKNGGGITRELLTWPPAAGADWSARISVATIAQDGPFSAYPGLQRWFAVLDGAGVHLSFGPAKQTLAPGDAPLAFHGKEAPECALVDGSTRDLNLMTRGGQSTMKLIANNDAFSAGTGLFGLYCATPGIWSDNSGQSAALKAHTLLWSDTCTPGSQWHFAPADAQAPLIGFWMRQLLKDQT